jgi:hypothetical protein
MRGGSTYPLPHSVRGGAHTDDFKATTTVRENMPRMLTPIANVASILTSGRIIMAGVVYNAGDVVTNVCFASGTTAGASLTHRWGGLLDPNRVALAFSADDTSADWTANTEQAFALSAAKTIPTSGVYFHALCVVGTTMPSISGIQHLDTNQTTLLPRIVGLADSGLTTPPALPFTAAALSNSVRIPYTRST